MSYPNEVLTEVCTVLIEAGLGPEQIAAIAKNIHGECEAIRMIREEVAWERQQEALMETGGPDDSADRKALKEAGRGHLLR